MNDKPLSVAKLAARWECSPRHIYKLIERGELHIFRAGGTLVRISAREIERWENGGDPIKSESTDSAASTVKPLPHGETRTESTDTDSASKKAKAQQEARLLRGLVRARTSRPEPAGAR